MAQNPELEAALIANPEDRETYRVYADWLQLQGDPRGELIELELRCEDAPSDRRLREHAHAYRLDHASELIGDLAGLLGQPAVADALARGTWRRGFVDEVTIDRFQLAEPLADVVSALLAHPSAALLGSLTLRDGALDGPIAEVLGAVANARALRTLHLQYARDLGDLSPLHRLRRLQHLSIATRRDSIVGPPVPAHALSATTLRSIAEAPWPLHALELDFENSPATAEDLSPVILRADLPTLASLVIRRPPRGDRPPSFSSQLCQLLVASPLAAQLETLHLGVGDLTRADYKLLVDKRARFKKLRDLSLPSRSFTERVMERR